MADEINNSIPENSDPDFEAMLAAALGHTTHDIIERAVEKIEPQEKVPQGHRSGYVAVVGPPNAGKSTLINKMLGEKIAIVSPKPQTTRIRQLGILTRDEYQVVFVDTPGVHKPTDELGEFMLEVVKAALDDADVILYVTDISTPPNKEDMQVIQYLQELRQQDKIIKVMNKVDIAFDPGKFKKNFDTYRNLLPEAQYITTTALDGYNVPELLQIILGMLPRGPRYYPKDQVSDVAIRDITAEMIREQVLNNTYQEVPHSIAVEVSEFKRRNDNLLYIGATIFVEREGQKEIIIGKGGSMLKAISSTSRREIETFVNSRVYLELTVKVLPNWRRDESALKRFGYRL